MSAEYQAESQILPAASLPALGAVSGLAFEAFVEQVRTLTLRPAERVEPGNGLLWIPSLALRARLFVPAPALGARMVACGDQQVVP
jgi:hypothetical protein